MYDDLGHREHRCAPVKEKEKRICIIINNIHVNLNSAQNVQK